MKTHGYFGNDSMTWKVASEALMNLGGARAVLMQIAHPLVAQGVYEHSRYMQDPFGRTMHTFMLGQMLTFGSKKTAHQAARTINRLHNHVHGTLPSRSGTFQEGTQYYARDPSLLLWVHATLIDTLLLLYPLFIGPLSRDEQEQYYHESKKLAMLLGLSPTVMPQTVDDLRHYVHDIVYSEQLAATPQARQLARQVLYPPVPTAFRPLMHLHCQITCALLPPPVRAIYDLEWGNKRQWAFNISAQGIRLIFPHLPSSMRVLPVTRKLMQQLEAR